jgi:hypothetical protein
MKKKYLAETNVDKFYDDLYDPTIPTEKYPDGCLAFKYNHNNTENYLFLDGSIVSNGGDYREMSSTILPKKDIALSIIKNGNEYQLKIIDNKFDYELNMEGIDYSNRTTILNSDGSSSLKTSDEQGFNESFNLNKNETEKLFKETFGLELNQITDGLKQKNIKSEKKPPLISDFLSKYKVKILNVLKKRSI